MRSAGPEESISSRARDPAIIARWAIMTPVGSPVVPEAQMKLYRSSPVAAASRASTSAASPSSSGPSTGAKPSRLSAPSSSSR